LLQSLLGVGTRAAAPALIDAADLDPTLPPQLGEFLARANDAVSRGKPAGALAQLALAREAFEESPWPVLLEALIDEREGRAEEAGRAYARAAALDAAVARDDTLAQHFHTRGLIHLRDERIPAARRCFELAHRLLPGAPGPLDMLGYAGYFEGDVDAARSDYDRALAVAAPNERGILRINRLIDTLPQIFSSLAEVDSAREAFSGELEALLSSPPSVPDPLASVHRTVFYLGYQGRNDRDLNAKVARLFLQCCPALARIAAHVRTSVDPVPRPRVGFVSMNLNRHSVGAWYNGLVRLVIESARFDCVLFTYRGDVDPALRSAAEVHGRHVFLEATLGGAREQIEACRLDMLIYTDVGMHPFPYFLSFARLAPVQALLVGHPCTSGVPALDYFVSNVHQDHEAAQAHYGERLVRLPTIPVYVEKTAPPTEPMTRAECGWSDAARIYLCPMMLQKLHPDFDWALGEILRRDPRAQIVLFGSVQRPLWDRQLERRFRKALPDCADRIVFRAFAPREELLNLLMQADCVLDTFHFSGGVTTYIALSLGVPVVTLPGDLFRSRMTAGIYAQAGITGCTARSREHYVELALELARNRDLRAQISAKIVAAQPLIFETREAAGVLMDWIAAAVAGGAPL
jgi:predicted O-linked N-acetylglucosamine transferase (SPINDLY family)